MGHTTYLITAPVNTDDVGAVYNSTSHDVATLCLLSSINKWNKDKPYRGTQPEVKSRTVHNGTNETGMYLGSRGSGTTTGFPCYWGMRYPMNTAQQNASGVTKNTLLEICHYVAQRSGVGGNYQNYVYQKPVVGTDFCRLDDFVGHNRSAGAFLDAGVAYAEPGTATTAKLSINKFDEAKLSIYAVIPSNSYGFEFKDLIPDPERVYLVAEFYKETQWNETTAKGQTSASNPFYTAWLNTAAGRLSTTGNVIQFDVPLSTILLQGGFSTSSNANFYVCVGFNRRNVANTEWVYGEGFIAPWNFGSIKCATKVTVYQGSPYVVAFLKYAWSTSNTYNDFSTSVTVAQSDTMKFQATITNNGQNPLVIRGLGSTQSNGLLFRARAFGNYRDYSAQNGGHTSAGGTDTQGAPRVMKIGTLASMGSNVDNISIPADGKPHTVYFQADNLLPHGHTSTIEIMISNDNGATWGITGMKNCNFNW